ncbi:MAG TPA: hypothetical protein ACHBX0_00400 [Arsenophonus sp.]
MEQFRQRGKIVANCVLFTILQQGDRTEEKLTLACDPIHLTFSL